VQLARSRLDEFDVVAGRVDHQRDDDSRVGERRGLAVHCAAGGFHCGNRRNRDAGEKWIVSQFVRNRPVV
jgi:hypothetical protein